MLSETKIVGMIRSKVRAGIYGQHSEQAVLVRYIEALENALADDLPVNAVGATKVIAANMDERAELRRMTQILDA